MAMVNRLVLLTGSLKGREVPIKGSVTIGRNPENVIQIDDLQVSRKHAQVVEKDDGIYLVDLGSGNGTFIGPHRIVEHRLDDGDVIRMGRQQMLFRAGERSAARTREMDVDTETSPAAPEKAADSIKESPAIPKGVSEVFKEFPDLLKDFPDFNQETPGPVQETPEPVREMPEPVQETPGPVREIPEPVQEIPEIITPQETEEHIESRAAENLYETFFAMPAESVTGANLELIQKRLRAVYAANQTIASERSLDKVFDNIMSQIFLLIQAHNGLIMLKQENAKELSVEYVRSADPDAQINVSSTIIKRVFEQGEAVITSNAADDSRFDGGMSIISGNITSAMCVPLTHQDEKLGVLYVDTRGTTSAFTDSDLEMLVALAAPAATAIKNAQYVKMVEQAYEDTLIALANAIELRDHYTVGHTWRVTNFAVEIARELNWDEKKLNEVQMGGVLHDVGKIAVDNAVLGKPGKLTEEEFEQMKVHPQRGADLLRDIKFLHPLIPYCLYHHERWDGTGYPAGLQGEEIPIEGRIISVADAFDAMTSTRPYRKGMDPKVAMEELIKCKGKQFDPALVDVIERCLQQGKIDRVLQDYYRNEARSIACPFCSTFIRFDDNTIDDGSEISCSVCHRTVQLIKKEETYFGVLAPKAEA